MVTHPIETLDGLVYSVTHLDETLSAMRDAIVESWENDVINGDASSRGNFFGRATAEVLLVVVGTKGVDKVSKLGKVGGKGSKVSRTEKVKEKAVKISRETANGVKVAWNKTKEVVGNLRIPVKVNVAFIRTTNGPNIPIGINVETKSVNKVVQYFVGKGKSVKPRNFAGKIDAGNIPNMSKKEILEALPSDWNYTNHNGFIHIRDDNGVVRMRIDPPDKVTNYDHVHIFDENGNPLDVNLIIIDRRSPDAHIPYKK